MIDIDAKSLEVLQKELIAMHRSKLPNAVRFTLNDLAFNTKKVELIPSVHKTDFTLRKSDGFFRKHSGVEKATGWDINKMEAEVGMMPNLAQGGTIKSVENLKEQEQGGSLKRNITPLNEARRSKSPSGRLQSKNYWNKINIAGHVKYGDKSGLIKNVVKTGIQSGGGSKATAIIYGNFVYGIIGYKRIKSPGAVSTMKLHLTRLYQYKKNNSVQIKPQHFVKRAGLEAAKSTEAVFRKNAERQLNKFK